MTTWYTEYSIELVNEIVSKTSLEVCFRESAMLKLFGDMSIDQLFLTDESSSLMPVFYASRFYLCNDIKLSREDFVKKCVELYPPKREEES